MITRIFNRSRFLTFLLLISLACFLAPSPAFAEGATTFALATFAWGPWLAYVGVTIIFEAICLGKWLHVRPLQALARSLIANLVTAVGGGLFAGVGIASLGLSGDQLNPNPFGQALLLLALFGCGSALIEAAFWPARNAKKADATSSQQISGLSLTPSHWTKTVVPSLVVHLIGVPIALAVLLIPARPYPGLESQTWTTRVLLLQTKELPHAIRLYAEQLGELPPVQTYPELLQLLRPKMGPYANDPGLWAAAYLPDYNRFDITEERRLPIEWNVHASGMRISDGVDNGQPEAASLWLVRSRYEGIPAPAGIVDDDACFGVVYRDGIVRQSNDDDELGY